MTPPGKQPGFTAMAGTMSAMPASPAAGASGQKNPSLRERFQAMRNLPPFLRQVWQTSPALASASLGPVSYTHLTLPTILRV